MKRLILAITLILIAGAAFGQPLYSAKFVCGRATNAEIATFTIAPGSYFTAINVHNPNGGNVGIRKRFSVGRPSEQPGQLSGFVSTNLPPARTMLIECRNIYAHLNIPVGTFIEGVVEIRSNLDLDVVGVYTAAPPNGGVSSITMERVPKR